MRFSPAQIHAENHLGPILRLGSTGAGLNVDERIACVHLPGEHAAKFKLGDSYFVRRQVCNNFIDSGGIIFVHRERQQFVGVCQAARQFVEADDNRFKLRTFSPQSLRPVLIAPDVGHFQFALNLGQALCFALIVKGTSSTQRCVQLGR